MDPIFGIDAASGQQYPDWSQVGTVCRFGAEKVTQGTSYVNPYWAKSKPAMLAEARATRFVPLAYLFLNQGNGAAQARYFAAHAGNLSRFGIGVDVEPWYPLNAPPSLPTLADLLACIGELRQLFPAHPLGGYLPPWYWGSQSTRCVDWLWPSRYVTGWGTPAGLYRQVPGSWWAGYGGRPASLLQFTSSAIVPGVAGRCDCSAFRGTRDELAALILPGTTPPPPPPRPIIPEWQVTIMHRLPLLAQGSHDHGPVTRMQALLGAAGVPVAADGLFGPVTDAAVRHVQAAHGMVVDGRVGPDTWSLLVTGARL
jgi:Putative peptidoglycan binding domain